MPESMGARLSALIEALGVKRVQFAEQIKVDQSYITQLTKGRNIPSDRVISNICDAYNVNEKWLRTGEGEMFVQLTRSQEIADFMSPLLREEADDFKRRFITMLSRLDEDDWKVLAKMADEMTKKD